MIWSSCGIVFIHMTAHAIGRDAGITAGMTADATDPDMGAGERESSGGSMVERGRRPCSWGMTGLTIGGELGRCVVWTCCGVEIC